MVSRPTPGAQALVLAAQRRRASTANKLRAEELFDLAQTIEDRLNAGHSASRIAADFRRTDAALFDARDMSMAGVSVRHKSGGAGLLRAWIEAARKRALGLEGDA
jgi:predicted aminopeptidase